MIYLKKFQYSLLFKVSPRCQLFNNFIIFRRSKTTKNTISFIYIFLSKNLPFLGDIKKGLTFAQKNISKRNSVFVDFDFLNMIKLLKNSWHLENTLKTRILTFFKYICLIFKVFPIDPELFINIIVFRSKYIKKKELFFTYLHFCE